MTQRIQRRKRVLAEQSFSCELRALFKSLVCIATACCPMCCVQKNRNYNGLRFPQTHVQSSASPLTRKAPALPLLSATSARTSFTPNPHQPSRTQYPFFPRTASHPRHAATVSAQAPMLVVIHRCDTSLRSIVAIHRWDEARKSAKFRHRSISR